MDEKIISEKWEYRIISDRGRMHRVTMEELNDVGSEGWELVTLEKDTEQTGVLNFFFKRRKVEG